MVPLTVRRVGPSNSFLLSSLNFERMVFLFMAVGKKGCAGTNVCKLGDKIVEIHWAS